MSEQKGIPLIISLRGARERLNNQLRRLSKALTPGGAVQASIRWHSLERGCKRAQVQREKVKMWVPWNGLIVIGKRVELLGRKTQKPRTWDPRVGPENLRPESVGKTVLKEKAGLSQEGTGSSTADALQDSAREIWGKQDVKRKIGAESNASGMTAESRKGWSLSEEMPTSTGNNVGTSGDDLRSREYQLQQKEGQKLSGEKRESRGEKRGSTVEKRGSTAEKRGSTAEKRGSIAEKPVYSGEKRGSNGENPVYRREKRGSSGEKMRLSREKLRSSEEKPRTDREDSRSIGDKAGSSEEKLESNGEKRSRSEENIERVIEITGDERGIEFTDEEMEIPSESTKMRDEELEGIEEGIEIDEDSLHEVKDITGEFVSMEEKNITGEGPSG
ncbi:uncharacterized protein LOC124093064 [Marmota monax]|uniref:uncharacterized protein LOC124093064 n=1 Tax=Marmota monax TaxID=9995 RepID=UPI0026EBD64A|nr:uncharacterized protein LOC124093064 [Marmota monax]XP_046301169.2 uncharacterized protein LOC124093064 [Marmota monax]XP_046301170.2 uncharacterized protein LOC124093064 [Marmota monax]XP_046301171.2 uncharacterized protein LOC124093064 [Marmota monax]XP_058435455.1 uncharacterized protein LOC124093064 [Marmota monax]